MDKQVSISAIKVPQVGKCDIFKSGSKIGIEFLKKAYYLEDTQLNAFYDMFELTDESSFKKTLHVMEKSGKYDKDINLKFICKSYDITLIIQRIEKIHILQGDDIKIDDSTTLIANLIIPNTFYDKLSPEVRPAFINLINVYQSKPEFFHGKTVRFATELARILSYIKRQSHADTIKYVGQLYNKYAQQKMLKPAPNSSQWITPNTDNQVINSIVHTHTHAPIVPPTIEEVSSPISSQNYGHPTSYATPQQAQSYAGTPSVPPVVEEVPRPTSSQKGEHSTPYATPQQAQSYAGTPSVPPVVKEVPRPTSSQKGEHLMSRTTPQQAQSYAGTPLAPPVVEEVPRPTSSQKGEHLTSHTIPQQMPLHIGFPNPVYADQYVQRQPLMISSNGQVNNGINPYQQNARLLDPYSAQDKIYQSNTRYQVNEEYNSMPIPTQIFANPPVPSSISRYNSQENSLMNALIAFTNLQVSRPKQ